MKNASTGRHARMQRPTPWERFQWFYERESKACNYVLLAAEVVLLGLYAVWAILAYINGGM